LGDPAQGGCLGRIEGATAAAGSGERVEEIVRQCLSGLGLDRAVAARVWRSRPIQTFGEAHSVELDVCPLEERKHVRTSGVAIGFTAVGDSEAWARRLLWIDFTQPKAAKVIHGFDGWLLEHEGSGILNWMLEGAVKLLAVLDRHEPFPMTAEQRQRVDNLLSESDAARKFITTCVQRSPFPLDCITATDLFSAYLTFCDERGWSPLSQRAFEMKAKDLMVQVHRACPTKHLNQKEGFGGQRGYQGVTLKQSSADEGESEHEPQPF
jgi:hypothetical protein